MTDPNSSSDPMENIQEEFGSGSWFSDQLSNPLPDTDTMDFDEQAWLSAESKRISEVINNLENGLVAQKDEEIDELKSQLERKDAEIAHLANKIVNLKRYLVWENKEFGKLIGNLAEVGSKDVSSSGAVLNVGPFKDGDEVDDFHRMLKEMSVKLKDGVAKGNHGLVAKISHMLLKIKGLDITGTLPAASSTTIGVTTDNEMGTIGTIPSVGTSSTNLFNKMTAFIIPPGTPNRAIPASRHVDYNASNVFIRIEGDALSLLNSSITTAKHGVDLTKLDKGHVCLCGEKFNSAESLGQHLIGSSEQ